MDSANYTNLTNEKPHLLSNKPKILLLVLAILIVLSLVIVPLILNSQQTNTVNTYKTTPLEVDPDELEKYYQNEASFAQIPESTNEATISTRRK